MNFNTSQVTYGHCEVLNRPTSAEGRALEHLHGPQSHQEVGERVDLATSGFGGEETRMRRWFQALPAIFRCLQHGVPLVTLERHRSYTQID